MAAPDPPHAAASEAEQVAALATQLGRRLGPPPPLALVLGSGWSAPAAGRLQALESLPMSDLEGWPRPGVAGHQGTLQRGRLAGSEVVLCAGRVHAYEGHPARVLVRGVRALAAWGVTRLLLANAAGSLREDWPPGTFMLVRDHLNAGLPNPLAADQTLDGRACFLDTVELYDPGWRTALLSREPGLNSGVYAGVRGPSYETPAEVSWLRAAGADAVGMSTIPEALAAAAAGMKVLALSLLTNLAAGLGGSRPSHEEVLQVARTEAARAAAILETAADQS